MARADLIKKLFRGYQVRDDRVFRDAAEEIIQEERKKHHPVLANELEKLLKNGNSKRNNSSIYKIFEYLPKDADKKTSLVEIKQPQRYLKDLVLNDTTMKSLRRAMREFREWEVLEANGLPPVRNILFCGPVGLRKKQPLQKP